MGRGALFALLVHAGLLIALAFGVSWRSSAPTGATAELWAAVPEAAAPAAVAPPEPKPVPVPKVEAPPPPKPEVNEAEIALEKAKIEKAKRERDEREKAEALAKKRAQEQADKLEREKAAKAQKAEAERIAKLRDDQLKRIQGQAGATGGPTATGSALRDAGPSASYAGRVIARVKPNIVLTESVPAALRAEVEVRAAADGTILGKVLRKSSGNKDWDDAVLRAIDRTEVLPRDVDGRVPSPMLLIFTP
jgi:colicin import membrane protein